VYVGVRHRGAGSVSRPAADAVAEVGSSLADAGIMLSPESSESSGVGSKQSSFDNLLYVERNHNHSFSAHSPLLP